MTVSLSGIEKALGRSGLRTRGGFNFAADEKAPAGPHGRAARSLILAGHGGGSFWPVFKRWLDTCDRVPKNPLDTWSRHVIGTVAKQYGARAVYPSDFPYAPFQQWAMRGEGLKASPLGILMHPEYGLWHAYRGALLLGHEIPFDRAENVIHPCDRCDGKPCLNSCPANAFTETGYAVERCRSHLATDDGGDCRSGGCIARNACPFASRYRYSTRQQAFHLAAFMGERA